MIINHRKTSNEKKFSLSILLQITSPYSLSSPSFFLFFRDVLEEFGVEYLDLWGVESAAYDHSCFSSNDNFGLGEWQQDFTYSCIFHNFSKAYGPIGEVVVRWILHHLAIS